MHAGGLACLLNLPLEVFTDMCLQPHLHDLVRVAETCMRFRHDDDGLETVELSKTCRRLRRSASLRSLAPGWSRACVPYCAPSREWLIWPFSRGSAAFGRR